MEDTIESLFNNKVNTFEIKILVYNKENNEQRDKIMKQLDDFSNLGSTISSYGMPKENSKENMRDRSDV